MEQAASDTFSPVTGEVVETNQELVDNPGTVSTSPAGPCRHARLTFVRQAVAQRCQDLDNLWSPEVLRLLQVNKSPFDDGWLMKVKISDSSQLDSLMDTSAYKAECESH